jgi:hypothetical protein
VPDAEEHAIDQKEETMKKLVGLILGWVLVSLGSSGWAAQSIFDFGSTNGLSGPVGSDHFSVSTNGLTLTAYGFNADNSLHGLFWKQGGPDEQGIGLTNTLDTELTLIGGTSIANYIQIDVSQVTNFPSAQIRVQSVTDGEEFNVFGSNTKGVIGTLIATGLTNENSFVNIPDWGQYGFISVAVTPQGSTRPSDNLLMDAIAVIPEPGVLSLVLAGIVGLGLLRHRAR